MLLFFRLQLVFCLLMVFAGYISILLDAAVYPFDPQKLSMAASIALVLTGLEYFFLKEYCRPDSRLHKLMNPYITCLFICSAFVISGIRFCMPCMIAVEQLLPNGFAGYDFYLPVLGIFFTAYYYMLYGGIYGYAAACNQESNEEGSQKDAEEDSETGQQRCLSDDYQPNLLTDKKLTVSEIKGPGSEVFTEAEQENPELSIDL